MTTNIFAGNTDKSIYAAFVYRRLMTREWTTYLDIAYERYHRRYAKQSMIRGLSALKKAFPEVQRVLNEIEPGCIEEDGNKRDKHFRYVGRDDDPLGDELKAIVNKGIEDYVDFCKASAGMLPTGWLSSFFENTQLLLDTERQKASGQCIIGSSISQILDGLQYLPQLYRYIQQQQVVRFVYEPFTDAAYPLTFHPQYLKEYNGRWFVFGHADHMPYDRFCAALDRIKGEIEAVEDMEYIPAKDGEYNLYFNSRVGVSNVVGLDPINIVVRTHTRYMHGLLNTKPIHHTQFEICEFTKHEDGSEWGEFSMFVEPNPELCGILLQWGTMLEVRSPKEMREKMQILVNSQNEMYSEPVDN